MPKRVIDVGPSDGSVKPYLRETQGRHGEWATLSHCWGNSVTTKLTGKTLAEKVSHGISVADLSQNFQDAVVVTRLLGLRYIWIDSLCIIQDSVEDWLEESAKMADIYKNSTITIAATNTGESTTGFLRDRRSAIRCTLKKKNWVKIPVIIRPRIAWYGFAEITGPLTHRAWVLQERLLSPRILHFGGQQIMWQCRTRSLAEGFCDTDNPPVEGIPGAIESTLRKELLESPHPVSPKASMEMRTQATQATVPETLYPLPSSIYGQWYHIVQVYAHLRLTRSADKLPAIAGIAQQVHLRTGDTYLAGLWKSDIKRGLLWVYLPPSAMTRPSTPRAPSWSWAALDISTDASTAPDPADFGFETALSLANISYEHEVTLEGFSPDLTEHGCLGSSEGSIYLRGLYCRVTLAADSGISLGRFTKSYPTPLSLSGQRAVGAAGRLDVNENLSDCCEIGCLQIGKMQHRSPGYAAGEFITALLLQSVDQIDGRSSCFVRIGMAMLLPHCDTFNVWEKRTCKIK